MSYKTTLLLALIGAAVGAGAATNDWENLAVNSRNRLPPRTYSMPLAEVGDALTDALEPRTPYVQSLNGTWKLSWTGDPALRVRGFEAPGFDDSAWYDIPVPACVEMHGFGNPGYTNVEYPHARNWPLVQDRDFGTPDYNPVSSYRTHFTVPASWAGRRVILRFDGVYSAYYVWVNGRKVGYAEDSKLPSEFDVTDCLTAGDNVLAVEVYRWCDGSYLEDQDMFRFSGIFRDVTLWAMPKAGLWDFNVQTVLASDYRSAQLTVTTAELDSATLYDAEFQPVGELKRTASGVYTLSVSDVRLWSAEKPYLYTLVLKKGADIRMKRVGFKEQKIVGNTFYVNGQPIKFKGVNRHETNPDTGRTVTLDDMLTDITLMKRYNFNMVRTCHYPDHRLWYDLCDKYGLYVIAEANVEGHEPGYGEESLGKFPEFDHSIVERNERHAVFYRDNVSVTMWSMGNETGHGDCFTHAIAAVRKVDPSRPIHWERANAEADIDSSMYPAVEWVESRGKLGDQQGGQMMSAGGGEGFAVADQFPNKPYIMCEYAHAMGNAMGNFAEYWDVIYRYPSLTGGCIWDWVDQAIWKYTDAVDPQTGKRERYLAYGGDFDECPNSGPFCCNGVVDPFRNVSAKLLEVAHVQRNLVVTREEDGVFKLENRFGFTFADEYDGKWRLLEDGRELARGGFAVPHLKPLGQCRFAVPELEAALAKAGRGEKFVEFEFATRAAANLVPAGWVIARDQLALGGAWAGATPTASAVAPEVSEDAKTLTCRFGGSEAVFCRKSGTLCSLTLKGKSVLKDPAPGVVAGPRFSCGRAFVDNDVWLRNGNPWRIEREKGSFYSRGLSILQRHVRRVAMSEGRLEVETEVTGMKSAGFVHTAVWTFFADGSLTVANRVVPHGAMPPALPRLGLELKLVPALEQLCYYGRGPQENYIDRCTAAFVGLWSSTVTEQFVDYVRPQDNGYKCDVRFAEFTDAADGRGVRFSADRPLFVQALHFDEESLEHARQRATESANCRFRAPLRPHPETYLKLDVEQLGLGGNSCGPQTMAKYIFPIREEAWTLRLEPVAKR